MGSSRSLGDAQVDLTNDPLSAGEYTKQWWSAGVWDVRTQHSPGAGPAVGPGEGYQDVYTAFQRAALIRPVPDMGGQWPTELCDRLAVLPTGCGHCSQLKHRQRGSRPVVLSAPLKEPFMSVCFPAAARLFPRCG
ncbi:hypothetical protein GCM10018775_26630 [Streptomyces umbrinus]|nr:hypothetical protein GCM10018775_26630 [Streptomyces umbrinus]